MPEPKKDELIIACQQVLLSDGSVYSVQWLDAPAGVGPLEASFLLERYFRVIRRSTLQLVRPAMTEQGVEFRLLGTTHALLAFAPPRFEGVPGGEAVHLCISGGFLVQAGECDRGMFSLLTQQEADGLRITVQLSDYCPLLLGSSTPSKSRKLLYGLTQSYFHKVVTVRYLASLYRELTGRTPRAGVRKVQVREGTDI